MRIKSNYFVRLLSLVAPVLVIASVWYPEISHYYVPTDRISNEAMKSLMSNPGDNIFDDLGSNSLMHELVSNDDEKVRIAKEILGGKLKLPNYPEITITLPFSSLDLMKGGLSFQLLLSSLIIPKYLIDAYKITGQEVYFKAAKSYIISWSKFEKGAWLPHGFLWNDHAIAQRVYLLAKFWRIYRLHPSFNSNEAKFVLQATARCGRMLAKAGHFTVATNHGIMQNIALLKLAITFPSLPGIEEFKSTAVARLKDQLYFYINDEGVVLEHSAGYHAFGVELFSMALRYMSMLKIPIPEEWTGKYKAAKTFLQKLRRPDGSLPMYGNTAGDGGGSILVTNENKRNEYDSWSELGEWSPYEIRLIKPVSGYSLWWDFVKGEQMLEGMWAQTVTLWSYFKGHGHKHADELSVIFWAADQAWWTNIGYWPYGYEYQENALSWGGSNAPHLENEPANSERETTLLGSNWNDKISILDLERSGPVGYKARRQIIHVKPDIWAVIDYVIDKQGRPSQNSWTTFPNIRVHRMEEPRRFTLGSLDSPAILSAAFFGSEGTYVRLIKGSLDPFAGWIAMFNSVKETNSFVVNTPPEGWNAIVWKLGKQGSSDAFGSSWPSLKVSDANHWELRVGLTQGNMVVKRTGSNVFINNDLKEEGDNLQIKKGDNQYISDNHTAVNQAFEKSAAKYKKYRYLYSYRVKVSYLIIALFLFQECFFLLYRKVAKKVSGTLRILSSVGWAGLGGWLYLVYF